jgi:ApaG protein
MPTSEGITQRIRVAVESTYHPERSNPTGREWFFSYKIRIANEGDSTVQLLTRHWTITDSDGYVQEVRGPGVIGQQPVLSAGQSFEYTSFCPLATAFGTMHGCYEMERDDGTRFDVEIPPFALGEAFSIN